MSWIFALTLSIGLEDLTSRVILLAEGLNEDLHTAMETEDKAEGELLLDVVVQKGTPVFKLFASEDEVLLVRGECCVACQWTNSPTNRFVVAEFWDLRKFEVL